MANPTFTVAAGGQIVSVVVPQTAATVAQSPIIFANTPTSATAFNTPIILLDEQSSFAATKSVLYPPHLNWTYGRTGL